MSHSQQKVTPPVASWITALRTLPQHLGRGILPVVLAVSLSSWAAAQDSVHVAPDVEAVASGGRWGSDAVDGSYRAIVTTGGFDHVVSALTLEWLRADGHGGLVLVHSRQLDTASWRLGMPRFVVRQRRWYLEVPGVEPHIRANPRGLWVFSLGPPGHSPLHRSPTIRAP